MAALAVLSLGMIASFAMITTLDHLTRQGYAYLLFLGAAFVLYLLAAALVWRVDLEARRGLLAGIFALALLMRAPLWFTEPTLSTDVWRYLWEGRLLTYGVNPYAERVDSPALDSLATPLRARVEHQWMASPYPPGAQLAFGGVYSLFPESATAMQVVFTIFDLASGAVVIVLLKRLKRPTGRALLYLWNPLIVLEFAHSAHIDSLMTLSVLLALYWLIAGRQTLSMGALAVATLTRLVPVLLLPVFIRRWGWQRTLTYGALVGLAFLPFIGAGLGLSPSSDGTGIFGAVRIYTSDWKTNDGLFYWLVEGLEQAGVNQPVNTARVLSLAVLAGLGIWVLWRTPGHGTDDADQAITGAALIISGYLLLTAAMFPWYLTWLIALLPLLPLNRLRAWWLFMFGWVYFSAAVNLSYLFYLDPGNPREIEWIRRAEYWPLFVLLAAGTGLGVLERRLGRPEQEAGTRPSGDL
jgi:hypothetical protein